MFLLPNSTYKSHQNLIPSLNQRLFNRNMKFLEFLEFLSKSIYLLYLKSQQFDPKVKEQFFSNPQSKTQNQQCHYQFLQNTLYFVTINQISLKLVCMFLKQQGILYSLLFLLYWKIFQNLTLKLVLFCLLIFYLTFLLLYF